MSLKAKHWEKYGVQAEYQVKHQAANNNPPMGVGQTMFSAYAVFLVQEAYNQIIAEYDLSNLPVCPETGSYDLKTSMCIGKLQDHFQLNERDSKANKETLKKMDELLVKMETPKLKPSTSNFARPITQSR